MVEEKFNIWCEKLNIGVAIQDIGIKRNITLWFDDEGRFIVASGKMEYYPTRQERPKAKVYVATIRIESEEGDWPKYAAEQLLCDIEEQMENRRIRDAMH